MKWVFGGIIILSTLLAIANGKISDVSSAIINEGETAIKLIITIAGSMCWWSGMMRIMEKSGLSEKLSNLIFPITSRIFSGLGKSSKALKTIAMNISANMLGVGNAATPLGIKAMKELSEEENAKGSATNNMILFVVLNTASVQLLPTTIALLRAKAGAKAPLDILPYIILTSACSVIIALTVTKIVNKFRKNEQ